MNYGMPYMGSKNRIAKWVIDNLPPAKHFYDLFGGGGAISHCALESGKFEFVHYNELNPLVFKTFKMSVCGDFKNENRWISREDFQKLKYTDPYVASCFSFGNNFRSYAYSKEIEPSKKAVHYSIMFNDNTLLSRYIDISELRYESENIYERRIDLQRFLKRFKGEVKDYCCTSGGNVRNVLQSLLSLERLQSLELDNLDFTNLDYRQVKIEDDSVIYCDPPYKNVDGYLISFNHKDFYEWSKLYNNIYISEYAMPEGFKCIASKEKQCSFVSEKTKKTIEKIFVNSSFKTLSNLEVNNLDDW